MQDRYFTGQIISITLTAHFTRPELQDSLRRRLHPPKFVLSTHVSWLASVGTCYIFIDVELFACRIAWGGRCLQSGSKKYVYSLFSGLPLSQQLLPAPPPDIIILIACYSFFGHQFISFYFCFFPVVVGWHLPLPCPLLGGEKEREKRGWGVVF